MHSSRLSALRKLRKKLSRTPSLRKKKEENHQEGGAGVDLNAFFTNDSVGTPLLTYFSFFWQRFLSPVVPPAKEVELLTLD